MLDSALDARYGPHVSIKHSTEELIDFATLNHLRLAELAIALLVVPAGQRWEIYRMVEE